MSAEEYNKLCKTPYDIPAFRGAVKQSRPRPIHKPGEMNKTESAYATKLRNEQWVHEIVDYKFEPIKFRLADKTFYTPDFMVVYNDRFEFHEVKGYWEDDARVKIKVVAEMFPWFKFVGVTMVKKEWKYEEF